jgi:CheY-like chemotaxis protein
MSTGKTDPSRPACRQTILVVDDDPGVRETIARVLATEGYVVLCAANGAEALGVAGANRIDLVLLDLNMPVKGGWDTFERLTTDNPFLAIIIITARPNQLFTALGAGVSALLEKPFDYPGLLRAVRTVLEEPARARLARMTGHKSDFYYHAAGESKAAA